MDTRGLINKWIILSSLLFFAVAAIFYFAWNRDSNNTGPETLVGATATTEFTVQSTVETASVEVEVYSPISPVSPINSGEEKAETRSPEDLQALINMAIAAHDQGNHQRAIELADLLLAENPNDFIALNIRGSAYLSEGNVGKAIEDYSAAIESDPMFPYAFYNRGRVYRQQAEYGKALEDLQRSIELAPLEFGYKANGNIGLIYFAQGKYEESLQALSKSIDLNVEDKADIYFYRGDTYLALGKYEAAISDYQAAIERFPNFSMAYRGLAFARYKMGQFDEAKEDLAKAETIAPGHPAHAMYRALILLSTGEPGQANAAVQQGIEAMAAVAPKERDMLLSRMNSELRALANDLPDKEETIKNILNQLDDLN